ncbi:universal stress protein, partial [Nonomuraea sp. NPDC050680]|uniref:universal stress protein n=1 Tax=Nonomuraea sp. NPDC050680 TaxID=3154630 RepID=UPI0033EA4A2A
RADLLVVGSHGRSAIGSIVLGSVSRGVLHHARCTVTVVRAKDAPSTQASGGEPQSRSG